LCDENEKKKGWHSHDLLAMLIPYMRSQGYTEGKRIHDWSTAEHNHISTGDAEGEAFIRKQVSQHYSLTTVFEETI